MVQEKKLCCGCSACAAICPSQAICMTADAEGYLYPQVDVERCLGCGLCQDVCAFTAKKVQLAEAVGIWPQAYAAWNRSEILRLTSSSGGVFRALADPFIQSGGIVYGAVFDDRWTVCHKEATIQSELAAMQGSKYVQSAMNDCFRQVKARLQANRKVLFTGTPCQIGGLYSYLTKSAFASKEFYQEKLLYTAEIICHGVPSPRLLSDYLTQHSRRFSALPAAIHFRDKTKGWGAYYIKICFANGRVYEQKALRDWYYRLFLKNYFVRPSCYCCPYKCLPRQADVTLGDFWRDGTLDSTWEAAKGVSLLLVNNSRGQELVRGAAEELILQRTELRTVLQQNLCQSTPEPPERKVFFQNYLLEKHLWLQWHFLILPQIIETPGRVWQKLRLEVKKCKM